jgi:BASS family bile acid:Na+ symporter
MDSGLLDHVRLEFDQSSLMMLNFSIAFIMFGVALNLKPEQFTSLLKHPKAAITGLISQFLLLPFLTFVLIWFSEPLPGLAMGMILVATCPGGNISNFFSSLGKANVALSISLTAVASLLAVVLTPLNLEFWGGMLQGGAAGTTRVNIDALEMVFTIFWIIAVPLALGLLINNHYPKQAKMLYRPLRYGSLLLLLAIIILAFAKNYVLFTKYYHYIIVLVLVHNALALTGGYLIGKLLKNTEQDVRSITIETGIQNSGLGLIIIFNFFNGQGSMALIAAWWGIWHIISGFAVSQFFAYRTSKVSI